MEINKSDLKFYLSMIVGFLIAIFIITLVQAYFSIKMNSKIISILENNEINQIDLQPNN